MMTLLDQINTMKSWSLGDKKCPVCLNVATWFAPGFHTCRECFLKALEIELIREDISHWSGEQFSLSLSASGDMKDRLLALIHFADFQTLEGVAKLLIENLGFDPHLPLGWYARQKAHEACVFFADSEKMLQTILGTEEFDSWQQKANMVKVCYEINPKKPEVIQFIKQMASDQSPNVRHHVANIIQDNQEAWAKALCNTLRFDANPLVREAFARRQTSRTPASLLPWQEETARIISRILDAENKLPVYNKTEQAIRIHCNFPMQDQVYTRYLSQIPDLLAKNKYTQKKYTSKELATLKENTFDSCVRLLAVALSNDFLFNTILEKLPENVVNLLYILAWECEVCDTQIVEQKLAQCMKQGVTPDTAADKQIALHESVAKDPAYFMFKVSKKYIYYLHIYIIYIRDPFRVSIKKRLPPPKFARLAPVANIKGKVEQVHEDHQEIFQQLPAILGFIAQGHFKYSKNGKELLKGSLKKMATACGIDEFYTGGDSELRYLKTGLLGDFFRYMPQWKAQELAHPAQFLKTILNHYFSFKAFKGHSSRRMFAHVKRHMEGFESDKAEKKIRKNFKKLLNRVPEKQWIATQNLGINACYDGIDFNPFSDGREFSGLYISRNLPHDTRRDNVSVQTLPTSDILTLPYIQAMMFLMGALGVVELGYSVPENNIFKQFNKSWLSIYDGLKYVRLTAFGNYVIGRKKDFTQEITLQSAQIEIDEHKTMLSIYGHDPVKQMVLEAVGQRITNSSYMVSYQSFLKECSSHKDVEKKIQLFRDTIIAKPPPIWETFFTEVLARINPLEQVPAMSVFRVKPDRKLLTLLTRDDILKKYVIRAENHHIVVKTSDFSKVKKRLALLGFFIS